MKKTIKCQGIVLRKRSLPNQDKIITLLTKDQGKISTFAKGIKKITSRRLPHVQTANLINADLYKKDERYYLQETTLISGFTQIKKDQGKLNFLYQFFFVIERLLPENQAEPEIYNLVMHFLVDLSKTKRVNSDILEVYFNKALRVLGYIKEDRTLEDLKWSIQEIIHEKVPEV